MPPPTETNLAHPTIYFRRSVSWRQARFTCVAIAICFAGMLALIRSLQPPLFLEVIFWIAIPLSTLFLLRAFIHAENDMFVEVSSEAVSWFYPIWTPPSASIPLPDIAELITIDTSTDTESGAILRLTNGSEVTVPSITGGERPIVTAIQKAIPGLPESSRPATFDFQSLRRGMRFLLRGPES